MLAAHFVFAASEASASNLPAQKRLLLAVANLCPQQYDWASSSHDMDWYLGCFPSSFCCDSLTELARLTLSSGKADISAGEAFV